MIYRLYRLISQEMEYGFYAETAVPLSDEEQLKLRRLIGEGYEPDKTRNEPFFLSSDVIEIGPRLQIETPLSSNGRAILQRIGLGSVSRIEHTRRYRIGTAQPAVEILREHLDRMTEQEHSTGIATFDTGIVPEPVKIIDLLGGGMDAFKDWNKQSGGGMDEQGLEHFYALFAKTLRRNPTDAELLQIANGTSEHSRHGFFKGKQVIDGVLMERTLFEIVQEPLGRLIGQNCSLVAFHDNAGVIRGFKTRLILPSSPGKPSEMRLQEALIHITCTSETHNHPTFVAPFPGAQTGAGGRIRDIAAVGRGGWTGVGAAGYCVGSLFIPGYEIPGEITGKNRPSEYAQALEILIRASQGVSSYGNAFGEPVTLGFVRTFEQIVDTEWRAFRKPILWSGGIGHIRGEHIAKEKPEVGMIIVRIGGPAFPIGVGGGSASSMNQGENSKANDQSSVQRGDPEEENRGNRVIRTCTELGEENPISSIHDQGAGGPSNVLTELMEPLGGRIDVRKIILGDKTMAVLQIWSAEFQEGYGLLIRLDKIELFKSICASERVNCEILGKIDGGGKVAVEDSENGQMPVDLDLTHILTGLPQKTFASVRRPKGLRPLSLPEMTIGDAIKNVFMLPSVGSKGYLVHEKDRSVTGLVAQQPTCGIGQIPAANCSVNAQSHFGLTGTVSAIGEQPLVMLIDPAAGARMAVGECLTNMASARIRSLEEVRCRANWIWPAKMPHEGALIWDAVTAMSRFMIDLGVEGLEMAPDGGKDSLTPVARIEGETIKAPGTLIIYGYAPVPDIAQKVTPDIKMPGKSSLALIDLGLGKNRLGGSALAQACGQLGNECPDIDAKLLTDAFASIQAMIEGNLILSLHDRSGGGLITAVAEMCMAARCGFTLKTGARNVVDDMDVLDELFAEELGFVLEYSPDKKNAIRDICGKAGVPFMPIGWTSETDTCTIEDGNRVLFEATARGLRLWYESTSYELEKLKSEPACARSEYYGHGIRLPGSTDQESYRLRFEPKDTEPGLMDSASNPRVAVIREEGSNGDREMSAACKAAGLAPFDVSMKHLLEGTADLEQFDMAIFVGGFSFRDTFGSAKGWAATILWNDRLREMFDRFYARTDTLSLGVCNGCQLMSLMGWVPWRGIEEVQQPRFIHNASGKFESRWAQVEVMKSPSALLKGMEGSKLGVWVAHGEGRLIYPGNAVRQAVSDQGIAPLAYIDPHGHRTEEYPWNPNGSPEGVTALCSPDGRHLAMMPHPERCFRLWQWPWMPPEWRTLEASPWLRMFQNARTWLVEHKA